MADPFAIIGLAASICSFLDFSGKVISLAKLVRESHDGAIPEAEELELIVLHVRSLSSTLLNGQAVHNASRHEQQIMAMAAKVDQLAGELSDIVQKLKVQDKTWVKTSYAAFYLITKKKDINSLETRLVTLDRSLRDAVNGMLQQSVPSDQFLSVLRCRAMALTRIGIVTRQSWLS
jgi:chromosome segregation ATPase